MGTHGMNHYEVGATQGHSKSKVDSMIKKAKAHGKALSKVKGKEGKDGATIKMERQREVIKNSPNWAKYR